jgi:hypothetical protein
MPLSLYDEFFRIVGALNEHQVPYAVCGGMAVSLYIEPRFTKDSEKMRQTMAPLGYKEWAPAWTFRNSKLTLHRFLHFLEEDFVMVDVLVGEETKYTTMVEHSVLRETPRGPVRLVRKEDLITLKSARNSLLDQADIAALQNEPNRTSDLRSERPVGLRPQDGLVRADSRVSGRPARQRKLARKSKKAPGKAPPQNINRPDRLSCFPPPTNPARGRRGTTCQALHFALG